MRISCIIAATVAAFVNAQSQTTKALSDALVVTNPQGFVYEAKLPEMPFFKQGSLNGNVRGSIVAMTAPDGNGVKFTVGFSNLPNEGGPFKDGNCTKALAHHDPFNRGEAAPCDASRPETCQIGDLSGKHGSVTRDYEQTYIDRYLSIVQGPGSFFGNRSFVFHFANKTRISCANFKLVQWPAPYSNGTGASNTVRVTNAPATATPYSDAPFVSAASVMVVSFYLLGAASTLAFVSAIGDV
ncbi:hypothetical protein LZ31DRAFT_636357 [Colletotrichum somersetense]|nr:hypothetical protein LZ31DRAFT_636357 [Colletotrichum somersetense]